MAPLLCAPPRKIHPSQKRVSDAALTRPVSQALNHFHQLLVKDFFRFVSFALFC